MKISDLIESEGTRNEFETFVYLLLLEIRESIKFKTFEQQKEQFIADIRSAELYRTRSMLIDDDVKQANKWLNTSKRHLGIK
jgi:FAD synthase